MLQLSLVIKSESPKYILVDLYMFQSHVLSSLEVQSYVPGDEQGRGMGAGVCGLWR